MPRGPRARTKNYSLCLLSTENSTCGRMAWVQPSCHGRCQRKVLEGRMFMLPVTVHLQDFGCQRTLDWGLRWPPPSTPPFPNIHSSSREDHCDQHVVQLKDLKPGSAEKGEEETKAQTGAVSILRVWRTAMKPWEAREHTACSGTTEECYHVRPSPL